VPFELIYGYCPEFTIPIDKHSNMPGLDQQLDHLAKVHANAKATLQLSKEKMKEQYKCDKKTAHSFNIGYRGCALYFLFFCVSLSFSHWRLLPQHHTHGCCMDATWTPC
jgi:hypothetical protein